MTSTKYAPLQSRNMISYNMSRGVNSAVTKQNVYFGVMMALTIKLRKFKQAFSLKTIFDVRVNEWLTNIQLSANN